MKKSSMYQYQTMTEAINEAKNKGFYHNLKIQGDGVMVLENKNWYPSANLVIDHCYRIEGLSDPADEAIVYAICTSDGQKGTLIEMYGSQVDPLNINVINQIKMADK